MNSRVLDYIKKLSIADKKTLSQKSLKTTEEVGELAKVILPFDSAQGTNHRFVDKKLILEEIVDVYLSSISIAYSLDFSDEEIEEMIVEKSKKWENIQVREEQAKFPLPYEITVENDLPKFGSKKHSLGYLQNIFEKELEKNSIFKYNENDYNGNIQRIFIKSFKNSCETIGVKPIVLDLDINNDVIKDVMTSSKHFGDNRSAFNECERIALELRNHGYTILRKKIETVPWHPMVPIKMDKMPENCYFECHIPVSISKEEKYLLLNTIKKNEDLFSGKIKLSKNFFKKEVDGKLINMITYRSYVASKEFFLKEIDNLKSILNESGFNFNKVETEFAIYDTNISHDYKWMNS